MVNVPRKNSRTKGNQGKPRETENKKEGHLLLCNKSRTLLSVPTTLGTPKKKKLCTWSEVVGVPTLRPPRDENVIQRGLISAGGLNLFLHLQTVSHAEVVLPILSLVARLFGLLVLNLSLGVDGLQKWKPRARMLHLFRLDLE